MSRKDVQEMRELLRALKRNPGVDRATVFKAIRIRNSLEKLGVGDTGSYDLSPALGGDTLKPQAPQVRSQQSLSGEP